MSRLRTREGKLSVLLLMLMLLSIAWSMELAGWVEGLYVVEWTVLGGLGVGFVMTRSGWPRVLSHLVSVLVGALLVLGAMTKYVDPALGWADGVDILAYHFDSWLRMVASGQASSDAAMFVLLMTLLGWWLGYTSVWMVFGAHKVWQALALTGGAMLLVAYASPPEVVPFFLLYVFCALLLAVRLYVFTQQVSWESDEARYDHDIPLHFLRDGGLLVGVVLAVVWVLPMLSSSSFVSDLWARVEGPWRAAGDEWNRMFSGIRGYRHDYQNVPFGQRLALGGPVDLGDDIVMWVETEGGRYWRGVVYDRYDGRGWWNTDQLSAIIPADDHLPRAGEYELREPAVQNIVPNWSGVGQVFGLGQPVSVDLPVEIQYSFTDVGAGDPRDPFSAPAAASVIKSRIPLNRDRPYTVVSSTSMADVESLREAGEEYPSWVTTRYLQLPSSLPERIGEVAQWITEPHDNVYDRAVALQEFLRRTIEYNEDIPSPPGDRDAVDYLLFDGQEGYCNYYASAMVVMARTVGIPSRLAVGYVNGELDHETGLYAVRERDTHAWVEVYFPRYGWVEFEPTASEEPIDRPDPAGQDNRAQRPSLGTASYRDRDWDRFRGDLISKLKATRSSSAPALGRVAMLTVFVVVLAVVVLALFIGRRRRHKRVFDAHSAYQKMCRHACLLGVRGKYYQTPYEYALVLGTEFPQGARQVRRITGRYVRERFALHSGGVQDGREVEEAWRELRYLLRRELVRRVARLVRDRFSWRV